MKIEKVNICGIPHKVKYADDTFNTDSSHFGQISYKDAEIIISNGMTPELEEETLIHEMLHGIFVHMGRNDLSEDETLVQGLANAIYMGFKVLEDI